MLPGLHHALCRIPFALSRGFVIPEQLGKLLSLQSTSDYDRCSHVLDDETRLENFMTLHTTELDEHTDDSEAF